MSFIKIFLPLFFLLIHQEVYGNVSFKYNDKIDDDFISYYCDLNPDEKAAQIRYFKNLVSFLPVKKRPFNYNLAPDRERKKTIELSTKYQKDVYPEQESAYKLGLIYSGIPCEIPQYKEALYYLSLAARKPETHFLAGKIYFSLKKTTYNINKAIDFFENAGNLGIKQGFINAIVLLRKYQASDQTIHLNQLEGQYIMLYGYK